MWAHQALPRASHSVAAKAAGPATRIRAASERVRNFKMLSSSKSGARILNQVEQLIEMFGRKAGAPHPQEHSARIGREVRYLEARDFSCATSCSESCRNPPGGTSRVSGPNRTRLIFSTR